MFGIKKNSDKKVALMTATQLAEKLAVLPKEVNKALLDAEYVKRDGKGYSLTQRAAKLGEQRESKSGVKYCVWKPVILKNSKFMRALESDKVEKEVKAPVVKKPAPKPSSQRGSQQPSHFEIDGIKVFNRKAFDAAFRTSDGHYVRSRSEVIVSDWLFMNRIAYAYEKRLPVEEELYSDFFIPDFNIYIEFWGYEDDPKYLKRKKTKKAIYEKYGFKLLELSTRDLEVLDDILPIKLLKLGMPIGR